MKSFSLIIEGTENAENVRLYSGSRSNVSSKEVRNSLIKSEFD